MIGLEDGSIYVKGGLRIVAKHSSSTPIQVIHCEKNQIYYINSMNNFVSIKLDHLENSRTKLSGFAALLLSIFSMIIVGFLVRI